MKHCLLIQFIIININILYSIQLDKYDILSEECKKKIDKKNAYLEEDSNIIFLLEIMRGKIPIKLEESPITKYDLNLIKRLNKNIPCVYRINNTFNENNKTMYFLGAGINLMNYNLSQMEDILKSPRLIHSEKYKYLEIMKAICNGTEEDIKKASAVELNSIDIFNTLVMDYTIGEYNKTSKKYNKLYKSPLINSVLAIYFNLLNGDNILKSYLETTATYSSYMIEHLPEIFPLTRLIQSKLIVMMDGNFKYNKNHIFFIIPLFLFEENDFNKIKEIITSIYITINTGRISILGITKNNNCSNYIINYYKTDNLDNFFKTDYKNKDEVIDLKKIYENLNNLYNENINNNYFENKISIFFSNYQSKYSEEPHKLLNIFDEFKKSYNIQTIPIIINNANSADSKDIFKYNIFYNFSEPINISPIKLAICYMHINIDLSENNQNEIKINNIYLNDIDAPIYIEVNINKGKKLEYYEISLEIKNTSGYNIFLSDTNPYPKIRYNKNNFLIFENNNKPILRIKTKDLDKFYIGIEGLLFFNISITKKFSENDTEHDNLILSYGEYEKVNYNLKFTFNDSSLTFHTFNKNNTDYKIYSNIFRNESIENMMKYFLRGIELENTNDGTFLNYELFLYLYGSSYLINRVYKDPQNNYYFGRFINLSAITPYDLKSSRFDRLFINKLYIYFGIDSKLSDLAPPISFNDDELKIIFDITYNNYVGELLSKFQKYPNCIPFEDQTPTMKFIIFCLYFSHYYDKNIIKIIMNLSLKEPEYSEVYKLLKDKKEKADIFLLNLISQIEQEDKLEKIMVSLIIGKSLALSDIGINFVKGFYNLMGKTKIKIALSVYDTVKNKIKNIISFFSTSNTKIEEINKYNKSSYNSRHKYNKTQKMDFGKIINFGLSQFSRYDNGIKKKIIIIYDENIAKDNHNYSINNELTNNFEDKMEKKLIDKQIDILLITSKNIEKGEIPDNFNNQNFLKNINNSNNNIYDNNNKNKMPFSIYENYFHISNLSEINIYMDDLGKVIKNSPIKIYSGKRLINDFYPKKITYYEINHQKYMDDVIVIKTNINNFNIYYSKTHPFPNLNNDENIIRSDKNTIIIYGDKSNGIIYLGLQPNNTLQKQKIEIFSCESYSPNIDCKYIDNNKNKWITFFFLLFIFILLFVIYRCKSKLSYDLNTKNKKRLNVFDKVK